MPPCQKMPCRNDGVCIPHNDNLQNYTCNCTAGFSGKNCEIHTACESESCNGGECIPKASNPLDFVCLCPFGRVGVQCETGGYTIYRSMDYLRQWTTLTLPSFSNCFIQARNDHHHLIYKVSVRFHCKLMEIWDPT